LPSSIFDDIIIIGDNSIVIAQVMANLGNGFDVKDLGQLRYFLNIKSILWISFEDTGMIGCKPTSSPMISNLKLMVNVGELVKDSYMYRSSHLLSQYQTKYMIYGWES